MKIVIVIGMFDSVHFARWLSLFRDQNFSFVLFPSSPHRRLHPLLRSLIGNDHQASYSLVPFSWLSILFWVADKGFQDRLRGYLLRVLIRRLRPDFVHAIELQNAGYILDRAINDSVSPKPTILGTNYGSDIYWFSRFGKHAARLKSLLVKLDRYAAECERDVKLASELGFIGEIMPVFPNAGGFSRDVSTRDLLPLETRKTIMIKGYHGWVGRAHIALRALLQLKHELQGYQIIVYSCNLSTMRLARKISKLTGLHIRTFGKGALTHDRMIHLFCSAKVYVGISLSDGISTSMLEAMACGAIPVQTSTACCDEWFTDTGVRVDTISPKAVADAILAALELAKDPSNAERNRQTIMEKASEEQVKAAALQYYR